jgi:hypothetical protein
MKGVPDCPHPYSQRLEINFSHEEVGSLTLQVVVAPITFGPPRVEGTSDSGGPLHKGCMDTLTSFSLCFPRQHYWSVFYPPYLSFIVFSSLQPASWPSCFSIAHCVHPMTE